MPVVRWLTAVSKAMLAMLAAYAGPPRVQQRRQRIAGRVVLPRARPAVKVAVVGFANSLGSADRPLHGGHLGVTEQPRELGSGSARVLC